MRPRTNDFTFAVAQATQHVVTRIEVLQFSQPIYTFTAGIEGTVSLDQNATTYARADLAFADEGNDLTPKEVDDLLAPYGNELRVSRGVAYADGSEELVSLGIFGIVTSTPSDGPSGRVVRVAALDRSLSVQNARFEAPFQIPAATLNYDDAIAQILLDGAAFLELDFPSIDRPTPLITVEEQGDRWKLAKDTAQAVGYDLHFDGDGTGILVPITAALDQPAWALSEGESGLLLNADEEWTSDGVYNKVIAIGENAGDPAAVPVRGEARDDNPISPTFYGGPFGRRPMWYASSFLTTTEQAVEAASAILARQLGTGRTISFGAVVNPALEPNDVVTVTREALGVDEAHVLDALTIPLSPAAAMTGKTRKVLVQ